MRQPGLSRKRTAVLIVALTLTLGYADVTFSDLPGKYQREVGYLPFCTLELELSGSNPVLFGQNILFNGSAPCVNSVNLQRTAVNDAVSRPFGIIVTTRTNLKCQTSSVYFTLQRTSRDADWKYGGLPKPFTYRKGVTFAEFTERIASQERPCIYRKLSSTRKPTSSNSSRSSSQVLDEPAIPQERGNVENGTVVLWSWLGPCIGAVATVAAAFIGVMCVRNKR